jgi:hypothetical protein
MNACARICLLIPCVILKAVRSPWTELHA